MNLPMGAGEYAPQPLQDIFTRARDGDPSLDLVFSGITGDTGHTYGYHRCRKVLPSTDYSVQLADDREGDGWAASAIDMKPNAAGMITITRRLIQAVENGDPRIAQCVREFFGTVNGTSVTGRDVRTGRVVTADDSHLWHIHISIIRKYATDSKVLPGVADVIAGRPLKYPPTSERFTDTMTKNELTKIVRDEIRDALQAVEFGGPQGYWNEQHAAHLVVKEDNGDRQRIGALEDQVAELMKASRT